MSKPTDHVALLITTVAPRLLVGMALLGSTVCSWAQFSDGTGREWRDSADTTGLTWADLVAACPRDGVSPCRGSVDGVDLDGWVWADAKQVRELLNLLLSKSAAGSGAIRLDGTVTQVSGSRYYGLAHTAVSRVFRRGVTSGTHYESTTMLLDMSSTLDPTGAVVTGSIGYTHGFGVLGGRFAVEPYLKPDFMPSFSAAWMWRPNDAVGETTIPSIPEPTTWSLWFAGLMGVVLARRRLQKR